MRSRYKIHEAHATYFVTSTIVKWLPVFTTAGCCDILIDSLLHCREHKGLKIYAWVILDNHFHAILTAPDLAGTLTDFKRYTARALLAQIEKEKREWLLNQLAYFRAAHKKESVHQVWQEGVHPQQIDDDAMMEQRSTTFTTTRWCVAWSLPRNIGAIARRMSGCRADIPASPAINGNRLRAMESRGQVRSQMEFGNEGRPLRQSRLKAATELRGQARFRMEFGNEELQL